MMYLSFEGDGFIASSREDVLRVVPTEEGVGFLVYLNGDLMGGIGLDAGGVA